MLDTWVSKWLAENPMRGTPLEDLNPEILELARGPFGMPSNREIAQVATSPWATYRFGSTKRRVSRPG